jgi:serine/threonine protein kinase
MKYIEKVGHALEYVHERHINHLDVKPANIMVRREDDEPILIVAILYALYVFVLPKQEKAPRQKRVNKIEYKHHNSNQE